MINIYIEIFEFHDLKNKNKYKHILTNILGNICKYEYINI